MAQRKTPTRLREMLRRQTTARYGDEYQPTTRATKSEAPGRSRPSQLRTPLHRRPLQLMSIPERKAAVLGAYNPAVFEIQEQRMLFTTEMPHPLSGLYPDQLNKHAFFQGTVEVADRLGHLDKHPTLRCEVNGQPKTVPWPYQGDLLLFLDPGDGPYCVNWPVKASRSEFLGNETPTTKKEIRKRLRKRARHEIELAYYRDADIRSEAIAGDEIDDVVSENLLRSNCYAVRELRLPPTQIEDVEGAFEISLETGLPPAISIDRLCRKGRITSEEGRTVFYQAIWHRRLRVDLFTEILVDQALYPETTDVLEFYADWFAR